MKVISLRKVTIRLFALVGLVAIIINYFALRYLVDTHVGDINFAVLTGRSIAIDPGHGGIDAGANWNATVEKEINLAVALKLAGLLKTHGATVTLTRDNDIDYYTRGKGGKRNDLLRRVEIIENSGAEVFVSIHANAIRGTRWTGAQVFYSPKFAVNRQLAEIMQNNLRDFPPGNKRQAKQDSGILVLNATNIPGVLIETGYISNPQEAARLADSRYQQSLAERITMALAGYFAQSAGR